MIKHLELPYNKEMLLSEFDTTQLEIYRPSKTRAATWFSTQNDWTTRTLEDECNEVLRLRTVFETIFDKEITPKFFKLAEGIGIPAHTDLGHKVCINIVLTGSAPVYFRSQGDCYYTCAMLNVAKRHSVPLGSERKMLKFQIADLYFAEAVNLWDNYYS